METGERWAKIAVEGDNDLITTREQVEGMRRGNEGALIVGGKEEVRRRESVATI